MSDNEYIDRLEAEAEEKHGGTLLSFDELYPPREGYAFRRRIGGSLHVGYVHPQTRKCVCGSLPVFEQYIYDYDENGQRNAPAKEFVAICPKCEIKMRGHGSLSFCRKQWNAGKFSKDGVMVRFRPKDPEPNALDRLSRKVIAGVIEEAVELINRKHDLMDKISDNRNDWMQEVFTGQLKKVRHSLTELENFILTSPLMLDHDSDAVLSAIRKKVYPGMKPEDRVKIPLKLGRM